MTHFPNTGLIIGKLHTDSNVSGSQDKSVPVRSQGVYDAPLGRTAEREEYDKTRGIRVHGGAAGEEGQVTHSCEPCDI